MRMNYKLLSACLLASAALVGPACAQDTTAPWTGFYAGVNLGGAWQTTCSSWVATAPDGGASFTGGNCPGSGHFVGGGQVGYNYQMGSVVFGLEGDIGGGTSVSNNVTRTTAGTDEIPGGTYSANGWGTPGVIGTVRARIGYAFGPALVYATGGGVFAGSSSGGTISYTPIGGTSPTATFSGGGSGTRTGWTLGGGLEYKVTQHWSVKAEDLFANFGNLGSPPSSCVDVDGGETCGTFSNVTFKASNNAGNYNTFRVGVNYMF